MLRIKSVWVAQYLPRAHEFCSKATLSLHNTNYNNTAVMHVAALCRWLTFCNPELSALITKTLGSDDWTLDMSKLRGLEQYASDAKFQEKWCAAPLPSKHATLAAHAACPRSYFVHMAQQFCERACERVGIVVFCGCACGRMRPAAPTPPIAP